MKIRKQELEEDQNSSQYQREMAKVQLSPQDIETQNTLEPFCVDSMTQIGVSNPSSMLTKASVCTKPWLIVI